MDNFTKATCQLLVALGLLLLVVLGLAYHDEPRPGLRHALALIALTTLAAASVYWRLNRRRDRAPDFLKELAPKYFNRSGFTFLPTIETHDGQCRIVLHFQNQYARACVATVALRPPQGFFPGDTSGKAIVIGVTCPGGVYGVATLPIDVLPALKGRAVAFDVGANCYYKDGKGRRLRYCDGIPVRDDTSFFNVGGAVISTTALAAGNVLKFGHATSTMIMPTEFSGTVGAGGAPEIRIVWQPGIPSAETVPTAPRDIA